MNKHNLPSYIHTDTGRAFLTLSADVYCHWTAGYKQWLGENEEGLGLYAFVGPAVNDGADPEDAMLRLAKAKKLREL